MTLKYSINSITFSGNDTIPFSENGITVIVGPNNSGKSSLLRELNQLVIHGINQTSSSRKIIKNVNISKEGTASEFIDFFKKETTKNVSEDGQTFYDGLNIHVHESHPEAFWSNHPNITGFQPISNLFCHLADTEHRLKIVSPPNQIDHLKGSLSHPIHVLQSDEDLEKKFSKYFQSAFGRELIVNHGAGSIVPLHMGARPNIPGKDRVSKEYCQALRLLPLVHEQGDGIKSFVGCLLSTSIMNRFVTLLDEPEAFLHPPQAKLLGNLLAKENDKHQLIIATHSGDILRGLLESEKNLTVLRITREGNINKAHILESTEIKKLWSDTILRFSNVLDGLFHEGVILCESDSDCRFYSAIRSGLAERETTKQWPDVLFASSGGKDRMAVVVKALNKIKVPIRVVVDFDFLANKSKLQELFEILGGDWALLESDYALLKKSVEQSFPLISPIQIAAKIKRVVDVIESTGKITKSQEKEIRNSIKNSQWDLLKESGLSAVSPGDSFEAAKRTINELEKKGIFLVPSGEIESFDKTIGLEGPSWVAKVLEKDIIHLPEFEPARNFIRKICQF